MEFGLLGPLEVRAGDGLLRLPARKQRALLALLLLGANRVVARERLIDQLWGEEPPESAVKALQVYVSQLRKLLPAGMLVTRPPGYLLVVESDSVDLLRFERLVGEARVADRARAAGLLREALGLWRGPPLAEFREEPFARVEAERLEDMKLAAVEQRMEVDLALGRHAELVGELEALVVEKPHRERVRGQLMLALYRSGRQADALEAYRAARAALHDLGLEPGAPLRQLEQQILTHDLALDLPRESAGPVPLPGPLVPESPFPFVGRTDELATLWALFERAERGEGGLVLIAAEAGGGKTRLVRELAHQVAGCGALVLYGASDAAVTTSYQPLREWLEFLLRAFDGESFKACLGGGEVLARLLPELAQLTGPPPRPDPDSDRYLLQSAAVELLRRLGGLQPVLVVADDLHWADVETLQLLRRLARTAPETRLLVLAAFREPGERIEPALADTLADLARLDAVTRIPLGNLSPDEMGEFVRVAAEAEATPELLFALAELTDGTPLLVCELWRDLRQLDAVEVSDAVVRLTRPLSQLQGPERVRDTVRARLQRLAPETAATLELAAVAGPRFEPRVLAEAAALEQPALVAALAEAVGSGIVEELTEPAPACRFSHELVRRAIYDRITGVRRAELHLRVGEALERIHSADPTRVLPELAHHFTLAAPIGGVARAVDYNLHAGRAALAAGALAEGAARLQTALELGIADPRERARVDGELSYPLFETGRGAEAEALLEDSIGTATGLGEPGLTARLRVQLSLQRWRSSPDWNPVEMERLARQAIEILQELGDHSGLAHAERLLGLALGGQGRIENLAAHERALAHADAAGDQVARRRNLASLGAAICGGPTPVPEGIGRLEELREAYRDDRVAAAVLTRFLSLLYAMADRSEDGLESARASSLVLDELQERTQSLNLQRFVAQALELAGDRAGAEREWTARWLRFRDLAGNAPDQDSVVAAAELAGFYCDEGRWKEAADLLAYGPDVAHRYHVAPQIARARLASHRGEHAEALTLIKRAVERTGRSYQPTAMRAHAEIALAEVQRAAGNTAEADAAVARALELYERKGNLAAADRLRAGAANA